MLDFLDKLREKDDATKRKVAVLFSAGITGIIMIFWAVSFYSTPAPENAITVKDAISPLDGLARSFTAAKDLTKDAFGAVASSAEAMLPLDASTSTVATTSPAATSTSE